MILILGFMAVVIILLYAIYFVKIIQGNTKGFELEILRSFAEWIINKGVSSKIYIWVILFLSLLGEAAYFTLTLIFIQNLAMRLLTVIFVVFEIVHLTAIALNLNRFFSGKYLLSQVFNWRIERASASLFFTHALLIVLILSFF